MPEEVVEAILADNGVPEESRRAAVALAGGRADRALEFAADEKGERLLGLARHIDGVVEAGQPAPLLDLAEELSRDDDLGLILETLAMFYRDIAAAAYGLAPDDLFFAHQEEVVRERAERLCARNAAERVDLIYRTCQKLERNANTEISLDAMLFELGSPGR